MGKSWLLDTNTVIYYLDELLPNPVLDLIETTLNTQGCFISVITKIELLAWKAPTLEARLTLEAFVKDSNVLALSDDIVEKTIELRRSLKIKLPDAIIAATALINDFSLVSNNDDDFSKVPGLKYLNPLRDL